MGNTLVLQTQNLGQDDYLKPVDALIQCSITLFCPTKLGTLLTMHRYVAISKVTTPAPIADLEAWPVLLHRCPEGQRRKGKTGST
jgi:hypothetical protein